MEFNTKITVKALKALAKYRELKRYSRLKRAELMQLLMVKDNFKSIKDLKILAKERGIKRYSNLKRAELIRLLNIMDEPVPYIEQAPLIPTPVKKIMREIFTQTTYNIKKWVKGIVKPIAKIINPIKDKIMALYNQPKLVEQAANGWFKTYEIEGLPKYDIDSFCKLVKFNVLELLKPTIKAKLIITCEVEKININTGETELLIPAFSSCIEIILESTNINEIYDVMVERIKENLASFNNRGSNWIFKSVKKMIINVNKYQPLNGSSWIDLPKEIKQKKAVINPKNKDNKCFMWAVLAALYPVNKNAERISAYKEHVNKLSWAGVEFPATKRSIDAFEEANSDVGINVFTWDGETINLWRKSKKQGKIINLLYITNDEKSHYAYIKNLNRLLGSQINKRVSAKHICVNCMSSFRSNKSLKKHQDWCLSHDSVATVFSKDKIEFQPSHNCRSMRVPFAVYADFECFTKPIQGCEPNSRESYTNQYQQHEPSGFGYYIVSVTGECEYRSYTKEAEDENIGEQFIQLLEFDIKNLYNKHKFAKPMKITKDEQESFELAEICYICEKELGNDRVRDHCHLTRNYRGAAHSNCNLNYKIPKFYPVFIHNLSGYDAHLFIKNLSGKISCIPNTEEKYISFSEHVVVDEFTNNEGKKVEVKREIRFLDSYKFMSSSLASLVANLKRDDFKHLQKHYSKIDALLRKGVFPYDYFNNLSILNEKCLPSKEKFYSSLTESNISNEDYEHAQNVWQEFNMKTFKEYHDLYMKVDVLQLADVFENFRSVCLEHYKLDPAWYYTAPGLSWDAMLKTTKLELDPITNVDQLLFFEKAIRGGVSMISHRYAKANNKYMTSYNPKEPSSYITYLDANNLYGWAMSKNLPVGNFKWLSEKQCKDLEKSLNFPPSFLEVDLEYPKKLHDSHKDYPLCPERLIINKVEKLVPNLNSKKNYIIHYAALNQCLKYGLKLTKIHRGITFNESNKLKEYINLNTELRTLARSDFEKNFFKLMNNSVFGKTMENIRNRVDVKLVTSESEAKKLTNQSNFKSFTIFSENLIAVHMNVTKLKFDKPIYLGAAILDVSKTLMYDFHYEYIKPKYGNKAQLLFTDTDSLMYHVQTKDFYKDIAPDVENKFDTSNYPKNHSLPTGVNKKVIGKFKDEAGGKQITEFVGLRAKLYSYKMDGVEEKKCKGINKTTRDNRITFDDYKECLLTRRDQHRTMNVLRSHKHTMYAETINKVALSAEDDKRIILEDGIMTVPYGYINDV